MKSLKLDGSAEIPQELFAYDLDFEEALSLKKERRPGKSKNIIKGEISADLTSSGAKPLGECRIYGLKHVT